jgi:hypothetical protein
VLFTTELTYTFSVKKLPKKFGLFVCVIFVKSPKDKKSSTGESSTNLVALDLKQLSAKRCDVGKVRLEVVGSSRTALFEK